LREIFNTNDEIAMLGEVLSPSPAPAHWDNFCRCLLHSGLTASFSETESLLDQYFDFVRYRIRHHWEGHKKSGSHAFGVDIKYNQLTRIAPTSWDTAYRPFILEYLRPRGVTLIHTTRNVIHCAISTLIASQRNVWHNYDGAEINRDFRIDVKGCVAYARTILQDRDAFLKATRGFKVVNCCYERLVHDINRADAQGQIPEGSGPLRDIAEALGSIFNFRYDGRLKKAINVPYSRLLSNYDALVRQLRASEFAALVSTLE
jgi:hypothetical protein